MKPHPDSALIWRLADLLSSAIIILTIGVAFAALLQAGETTL